LASRYFGAEKLVEILRGDMVESSHYGHMAISDNKGNLKYSLGNPREIIYPRSSCKMIQALPLLESGSADYYKLESRHLALACASHSGGEAHLEVAKDWLQKLNLETKHLMCGVHKPYDIKELKYLKDNGLTPTQLHNNCSGKHLGFLTISRNFRKTDHEKLNYIDIDHPVLKPYIQGDSTQGNHLNATSVINAIHKAGGMAFLAHPARYRVNYRKLIEYAAGIGIDGVEAWYDYDNGSFWTPSDFICEDINKLANGLGLLCTCGTDTHGLNLTCR